MPPKKTENLENSNDNDLQKQRTRGRELSDRDKKIIAQHMLAISNEGKLPWGEHKKLVAQWTTSRWTIKRIWAITKHGIATGNIVDVRS